MSEGYIPITQDEIQFIKLKIGKNRRNHRDWDMIKKILEERLVYTACPEGKDFQKEYSIEGVLKDNSMLHVFTTIDACQNYLRKTGI